MKGKWKHIIIDSLITIVCLGIIIGIFAFYKQKSKSSDFNENNIAGSINLKVYYKNDELVIDEKLEFTEGETVFKIIDRNHELEYKDDVGVGKGITKIDEYASDFYSSYFMLYVDGKYSTQGTELVKASDNMEIKLIWVEIK